MNIKEIRQKFGISQIDVAATARVSRAYVSELENCSERVIRSMNPQTRAAIENAVIELAIAKYWLMLPTSKKLQESSDAYARLLLMQKNTATKESRTKSYLFLIHRIRPKSR